MHYPDDPDARRLRMRSWRRGMKEMDLILGPFSDTELGGMGAEERQRYSALLDENDQALYDWMSGRDAAPEAHRAMVERVRAFHDLQ